jgi:ubiquinone/menaquinone biosynthesis C-methylase UbiE
MDPDDLRAEAPDIETSSADYASRFAGAAGRYLLEVQARAVSSALSDLPCGTALDVGGGHGQLVTTLESLGWQVTVQGSSDECGRNLAELHGRRGTPFIVSSLFELPVPDRHFDLAIAVRLVPHVVDWPRLVAEMCRVAARSVVIDYPAKGGFNALTPLLFGMKRSMEGNTRTYASFSRGELCREFARHGFAYKRQVRQFLVPMAIHRAARGAAPLRWAESASRALGLTACAGSPVILRLDRVHPESRA